MSRYAAMFERLRGRHEGAFGAFVMLGDPDLETSASILDALVEGGADMVELGIPFSDPIADGPVIQAAAARALARRDSARLLAVLRDFGRGMRTFGRAAHLRHLVVARGLDAILRAAAAAASTACSSPTVPMGEAAPFLAAARRQASHRC